MPDPEGRERLSREQPCALSVPFYVLRRSPYAIGEMIDPYHLMGDRVQGGIPNERHRVKPHNPATTDRRFCMLVLLGSNEEEVFYQRQTATIARTCQRYGFGLSQMTKLSRWQVLSVHWYHKECRERSAVMAGLARQHQSCTKKAARTICRRYAYPTKVAENRVQPTDLHRRCWARSKSLTGLTQRCIASRPAGSPASNLRRKAPG